ncbi:MAG TPA: OmpA family protein [Planctomycetota bacterium]|nr:OmpA family protein [Planctomycetota bacterium]
MLRFGFLGVLGAAMLATGCVSSSQHAELRAKYEEEAAKSRRLAEENRKLAAALKAKGVNIDDIRKRLDLIDADGGGRGIGRTLKAPEGAEDMVQLPNGGLRMGALNFRSGSAELTDKAKAALNEVANQLKAKPGFLLVVDGHTDSDPISKSNNASNWELAGKRAAAVVDFLVKAGACKGEDALLRGFGPFKPISQEKAKNRRVEIFAIDTPGTGGRSAAKDAGLEDEPAAPATPTTPPARPAPKGPAGNDPSLK